jgi:archaemetzincin
MSRMAPRDAMQEGGPAIALWWIGDGRPDGEMLEAVRLRVAEEFGGRVAVQVPAERPAGTLDIRRGQHSSREMLRWLVARAPADGARLLGVTDVDLFIPILTFVFGEAQLAGQAAVVSCARLVDADDRGTTVRRLACEAVHELGHTFGLVHCTGTAAAAGGAGACVMSRAPSVRAVDAKSGRLCPDCRSRYRALGQDGWHVYRQHENSHR